MQLYTNNNPKTTIKGLGFKNKKTAIETIKIVEEVFNNMMMNQKIPGYSSKNTLPRKFLHNQKENKLYYKNQKIFRILGMNNRAKGMVNKVKNNKDIKDAIKIFNKWLSDYKKKNNFI